MKNKKTRASFGSKKIKQIVPFVNKKKKASKTYYDGDHIELYPEHDSDGNFFSLRFKEEDKWITLTPEMLSEIVESVKKYNVPEFLRMLE